MLTAHKRLLQGRGRPARRRDDPGPRDAACSAQARLALRARRRFRFRERHGPAYYYRNASARGLDEGAKRAELNADPSLPKLSFHDLRHSAISHLIRSGADVVRVQRFAGHTKPSTTLDIYAHEFRARE